MIIVAGAAIAMAEQTDDPFNALDAFFTAAASDDPYAMEAAARNVTSPGRGVGPQGAATDLDDLSESPTHSSPNFSLEGLSDFDGKFIAIDPGSVPGASRTSDQPFILVPANIHSFLPWWAWTTVALGLAVLTVGVVLIPEISASRLVSRLADGSQAQAHAAMRQLVLRGDERAVNRLYDMAASNQVVLRTRLRAVDTLGLMNNQRAERALLRLELSGETDNLVRDAASAARRQREAAKTRPGAP